MAVLYTITVFVSAALLFMVQPIVAKLVLPLLGGSPSVWNTCMVFFQGALLAGYAGAHAISRLTPRWQVAVYGLALAVPIGASLAWDRLVLGSGWGHVPPAGSSPVLWLLMLLGTIVGGPFLVMSAAAPLMQRWFSRTGHRAAADPYFLYAASNAGSMLALLGYPLLLEPSLSLTDQRRVWSAGFAVFAVLAVLCGVVFQRSAAAPAPVAAASGPIPWRTRAWWVLLAFIPSTYMLGVTQYLTTDIAAVPLLWVIPLAIYLLTFIIAFSGRPVPVESVAKILPILVIGLAVAALVQARRPIWVLMTVHLLGLLLSGLLCNTRLAQSRPPAARLTEFYLLLALGGVLGGIFNALVAPAVFNSVAEYPIAIVLTLLVRPRTAIAWWDRQPRLMAAALDVFLATAIGALLFLLDDLAGVLRLSDNRVRLGLAVGIPALLCYFLSRRSVAFALAVGLMFATALRFSALEGGRVATTRTFFGVYHVNRSRDFTQLVHGTTVHGLQFNDAAKRRTPLGYYHPDGPIGQVFKTFGDSPLFDRVGLVGLGTGALAAYGRPGQTMTFYEIDPAMVRLAENTSYFTYLMDCRGRYEMRLGDGRLNIARAADGEYGLILLDAFSSDSIPVHLMTKEAVELYLSKLRPDGLLAFHISNQYLDLAPVLARIAAELKLAMIGRKDDVSGEQTAGTGMYGSNWILLARDKADFGPLLSDNRWKLAAPAPGAPLWTDDYSNVLSVFHWD